MEQETQLFVNIRLTGSGGSTWVTMKLAATWTKRFESLRKLVVVFLDQNNEQSMDSHSELNSAR